MTFSRFACTAVLLFGVTQPAAAQAPTGTSGSTAATRGVVVATSIDVNRLPIDLRRIENRFRQGQIREERDGLNLRYFVDVFAKAPQLKIFTPEDNLEYGPVPYGAPTHREMVNMITPPQFRNHGGVNLLRPNSSKK
jgi:hypothetical protein